MSNKLEDFFPADYTPNWQQEKILKNIDQAFSEGYKFVIACAPTGTGKSFVAKTLGNASTEPTTNFKRLINSNLAFKMYSGEYVHEDECMAEGYNGAFVLTITKTLQDQYNSLFDDIKVMKGKGNYICDIDDSLSVDIAPCLYLKGLKEKCIAAKRCPYYNARATSLSSKVSTLNYTMFFSLPRHVKQKQYIVCDEASELETELVKHFSCNVDLKMLNRLDVEVPPTPTEDHYGAWKTWVTTLHLRCYDTVEDLKEQIDALEKNRTKSNQSRLEKLRTNYLLVSTLTNNLNQLLETWFDSEYQIDRDAFVIRFVPLKVDKLSKYIFDSGKKILLMSATIIDHKHFAKMLGVDDYKYIEVDSGFDPKHAPIYVSSKIKLNSKNIETNLPAIAAQIKAICAYHKDHKGLIHTHTNIITKYLQNNLTGSRFLYREPGVNNEMLLDQHYTSTDPTVLVSPSMTHGVDLKDDLARFQIIVKAPYLPLGDKRVKKMFDIDKVWYANSMMSSIIQACGRGVRSKDDHCITYILDGTITQSFVTNWDKLPVYFQKRIK